VDLEIEVDNRAKDQRLRAWLRAPFAATGFEVESAFEVAERPIEPAPDAFGAAQPAERPIGATPQRSFATLRGGELALTVASRGCAEVEARQEGSAAALGVTLLRAVGWLSRGDLVLRPGHAGPPLETPGAQVPGLHRAELCLRLHAGADPQRTAEAHSFAVPPALFAGGAERGPLGDGARLFEVDDPELVVTALEPRPDGSVHARLFLASPRGRRVRVRWGVHGASQLAAVDLAGRPDPRRSIRPAPGGWTELDLRGWEIATLRAAPSGPERPRDAG
jgi:alpha-mannosidase